MTDSILNQTPIVKAMFNEVRAGAAGVRGRGARGLLESRFRYTSNPVAALGGRLVGLVGASLTNKECSKPQARTSTA